MQISCPHRSCISRNMRSLYWSSHKVNDFGPHNMFRFQKQKFVKESSVCPLFMVQLMHEFWETSYTNLYSKSTKGFGGCADMATFHSLGGRRPSRGARVLSLGGEFRFLLLSAGRRSAIPVFCPKDENEDQLTCWVQCGSMCWLAETKVMGSMWVSMVLRFCPSF